jgi:hypothetical protein
VGQEPGVKGERKNNKDGFDAAHQTNKAPKPEKARRWDAIVSASRSTRNPELPSR